MIQIYYRESEIDYKVYIAEISIENGDQSNFVFGFSKDLFRFRRHNLLTRELMLRK